MAMDSCASVNVMDEERFLKIQEESAEKLYLEKTKVKLYGYASETPIPVAGKCKAVIDAGNKAVLATFVVVKGKTDGEMLLEFDTAMQLGVLKITKAEDEYSCLFDGIGKHKHAKVKIRVDESVTPVNGKIPYHYQDKVKGELRKLEDAGVIESVPEEEPTSWISALAKQPKKAEGEICICVYMRKPNKAMKCGKREFPTVEDVLQ
ncbi:uncharacterized protein [Montipora foliosa]|uniref:uncharacterized protein n=1 Tax=Montipora foliosa TaxID=591990 RepID=UPI0035F1769E